MNTPNFASLLTALRAFVLKSRPAYKDYLGTESVEEKTVLLTGTLSATGESVTAVDGFTGFTNGQTYKAIIGEETVEVTAQYGTGSFSECIVIGSSNVAPSDTVPGWMVCVYNGNLLGFGAGDWAGKQIEVATSKMVPTEKWDVKKLPKECLPEKMPENWAEELDNGSVLYVPIEADFSGNEGTGTVKGVTFAEAQQAYKDGKMLVATTSIRMSAERDIKITVPMIATSSGVIAFELVSATSFKVITLQWLADGHVEYQIQNNFEFEAIPVTVTQTDGEYTATSTYTYEQVRALVDEGKNVMVNIKDSESHYYASLVIDNGDYLLFSTYNAESKEMLILAWSEDAIQYLINPILTEDHLSNDEPLPAGIAAPGTSRLVSRADHVHPKEVPDGATANQQLVTDSDGNTQWEDRPGGYTQKNFLAEYVYPNEEVSSFPDFCDKFNKKIGDTLTVVCNGITYENVKIQNSGYGDPSISQSGVFSFGQLKYLGGGNWGGLLPDTFPDGVTSVVFKDVSYEVDVEVPEKYLSTALSKKMNKSGGAVNGSLVIQGNVQIVNQPTGSETGADIKHQMVFGTHNDFICATQKPIVSGGSHCLQLCSGGLVLELAKHDSSDGGHVYFNYPVTIWGVSTPSFDDQVANKGYVDSTVEQATEALGTDYLILSSSTADSTKKFKITVDDSGTLTATEVTTTTT